MFQHLISKAVLELECWNTVTCKEYQRSSQPDWGCWISLTLSLSDMMMRSVPTNKRCMKVDGLILSSAAGWVGPSFWLPLTIHNTENFVHIKPRLHLKIKETFFSI